jgi:hypothetical protein
MAEHWWENEAPKLEQEGNWQNPIRVPLDVLEESAEILSILLSLTPVFPS